MEHGFYGLDGLLGISRMIHFNMGGILDRTLAVIRIAYCV